MHIALERQELCQRKCGPWCYDALHGRVVGQIQEHGRIAQRATLIKAPAKELGVIVTHTECHKNDGKLFIRVGNMRLTRDLGRQLVVRQTTAGKDRQLLAAHQRVHAVDGRNARHNHILRIDAPRGVDGCPIDVAQSVRDGRLDAVDRLAQAIKNTSKHLHRHGHAQRRAGESQSWARDTQASGATKDLDDGPALTRLQNTPTPHLATGQQYLDGLIIADIAHALDDYDRSGYLAQALVQ